MDAHTASCIWQKFIIFYKAKLIIGPLVAYPSVNWTITTIRKLPQHTKSIFTSFKKLCNGKTLRKPSLHHLFSDIWLFCHYLNDQPCYFHPFIFFVKDININSCEITNEMNDFISRLWKQNKKSGFHFLFMVSCITDYN